MGQTIEAPVDSEGQPQSGNNKGFVELAERATEQEIADNKPLEVSEEQGNNEGLLELAFDWADELDKNKGCG